MKKQYVIVLAPDSFKESMTAKEACEAMERGIKRADSKIHCIKVPMADGGEGTMQALVDATKGQVYSCVVKGPLLQDVKAQYGILGDGKTGVLEMASASGIGLVPKEMRNPLVTTTYGTGQLIKACLEQGVMKILIGIGGSATNDGGAGMLQALGGRLLDREGKDLKPGGGELKQLRKIDLTGFDPRLKEVMIEVACDVTNPLCGENGASVVFGPQKGATPEMIVELEEGLKQFALVIEEQLGIEILNLPGGGAAGGLGAGLMAFLSGRLQSGFDLVMRYSGLEEKVKVADMVWTGEGSIDFQTKFGKTPMGVAKLAKRYQKPVIALAGRVGEGIEELHKEGIDAVFGIMNEVATIEEALVAGKYNLEKTSENIIRLMKVL